MSRRLFYRLLIIVIHLVNALSLLVSCRTGKLSLLHSEISDKNTVVRLVGNHLRNDVLCPLQGRRRVCHFLFFADILLSLRKDRLLCLLL